MGSGFQFVDIIFFALVAGFIILRLRSVLGRRTGNERRRDPFAKPQPPAETGDRAADRGADVVTLPRRDAAEPAPSTPLGAALTQIKLADPSFDEPQFAQGARSAFDYIVGAFAAGDRDKLKPLLSEEVFANFAQAIAAREEAGHKLETTLVRIKSAEIVEARMEGQTAFVGVKYVSEQINVTRDKDGNVVDGNPDRISEATDIWTYARNTRSSDPNWTLVGTDVPQ